MFTFGVLPTIRDHYFNPSKDSWQDYSMKCWEFAKQLGIPYEERHRITIPCYFSIDWDHRHTWLREFIASPGRSDSAKEQCDREELHKRWPQLLQEIDDLQKRVQELELGLAAPFNLQELVGEPDGEVLERRAAVNSLAAKQQDLQQRIHTTSTQGQMDIYLHAYFVKSQHHAVFITITLEQFMPLSKISPEVHCPIEHLVRTVKSYVLKQFIDCKDVEKLRQGRTYQQFINDAVREKGNGEAGRHHLKKSVQKQEIICRILAAPKGCKFTVHYRFGEPGPNKTEVHEVVGTAGGWIADTAWT